MSVSFSGAGFIIPSIVTFLTPIRSHVEEELLGLEFHSLLAILFWVPSAI